MVDLVERIGVLLRQEETFYVTVNYLDPDYQKGLLLSATPVAPECQAFGSSSLGTSSGSSSVSTITEFWREKIVEWSFQVVDHFDYSREVVSVSIHYLDRYLAQRHVDKKMFQLAAMTTLFLAIKLYEPGKRLSMSAMIDLSRGHFSAEQMKAMELEVLSALFWQVHPPTAYCFSKHLLFLMPTASVSLDARHDILELARFLTELCVVDFYFISKKPSSVALAALQTSMKELAGVSEEAQADFASELERVSGVDLQSPEVMECRDRIQQLYAQGGYSRPENWTETRTEAVSPVCVSYGLAAQYDMSQQQHDQAKANDTTAVEVNMANGNMLGGSS